jgi:outer membrane protein assembly factor BamB
VPCTSCAATWTHKQARFCGLCGAPLLGGGDGLADTDSAVVRRWARRHVTAILAGTAAAALLVATAAVTDILTMPRSGDPEVALPTPEVLPSGNRLEPDETLALRQQVDPDRLRCEPRGCELWRHSTSFDAAVRGDLGMVAVHGLVVLLEDTNLVALDRQTGEQRWTEPLDDLLPGGATSARSEWQLLATLDDAVIVGTPHHVVLVDDGGHRRWVTPVTSGFWGGEVAEGRILLHGDRGGSEALTVLDVGDGSIVWERDGSYLTTHVQDGHVLTSGSRRVEVVSLSDGEIVWTHDFGPDSPISGGTHREVWLADSTVVVAAPESGQLTAFDMATGLVWARDYDATGWPVLADTWVAVPQPDSPDIVLVDSATGTDLTTFANAIVNEWTAVEDVWVLLLTPRGIRPDERDDQHPLGARLVAIDRDGDMIWETPVETQRRCCTWLGPAETGIVTVMTDDDIGGIRTALRIEVATGTVLEAEEGASGDLLGGWFAPDGTSIEWGQRHVTLRKDGHTTRVLPGNAWPPVEGPPWVFTHDGEVIGVQLMPDDG